jgi:diguanylate cyclase (GGDEF)-like protein
MDNRPTTVPCGTPLSEVADILSGNRFRYVLVSDADGRFVGVVSSRDLLRQLAGKRDEDQAAWRTMTVESVMATRFLASSPDADAEDVVPMIVHGSMECVPVLEGDKLVGVLTPDDLLLSWKRVDPLLRKFANDAVTELASRRTFDRRLEEEWERARRQAGSLSLIMVDIDHFKEINDRCGHPAGDAVLQMVGECLRRHLRSYDLVARFGGDEFVAVCFDCDLDTINAPLRRLQNAVRTLSIPSDSGRRLVTLSIGVAVIAAEFDRYLPADLIAAADACLYEAKRAGRDQARCIDIFNWKHPAAISSC